MRLIDAYVNQQATRKYGLTTDVYNNSTYGSEETIYIRFHEDKKRIVKTDTTAGEDFVNYSTVWLLPEQGISRDDLIVHDNVSYKVKEVDIKRDFDGDVLHKKALVVQSTDGN